MRFRDGSPRRKALFVALVGVYLLGLGLAADDKLRRVGSPDPGFATDGNGLSPTRLDASEAGLRGGGLPLTLNGVEISGKRIRSEILPLIRAELGAVNTLVFERPRGDVVTVDLVVRALTWQDVLFAEGVSTALGLLFFAVGVASFLLRPYDHEGWAALALGCFVGSILTHLQSVVGAGASAGQAVYVRGVIGFLTLVPVHVALAFPVVHPLLLRSARPLRIVYWLAALHAAAQIAAWSTEWTGAFAQHVVADALIVTATTLILVGRCAVHAFHSSDPLLAQRARILLAGIALGVGPPVAANFARNVLDWPVLDPRLSWVSLTILLVALTWVTVRHELLNARAAVRRAVSYAVAVGVLTLAAVMLVSVRPYAVALLLLPLLYLWPRFDARLNAWLYPKRARFSELLRGLGDDLAAATSVAGAIEVLAEAPSRLCDARQGVAFLFPDAEVAEARVAAWGPVELDDPGSLADEPVVKLLVATKKELLRGRIALEPQYSNIEQECYACFDRLGAEALLPVMQEGHVVGALAAGPREGGDPYGAAEIDALSTAAQQAAQAIERVGATERLRAREREFRELERFFPPQVIDQVMERGGAAELRSKRKLVTVFFADLRGFTSFSDSVAPEDVIATLAEYHAAMGRRIAEFAGTLERFVGDGFMVFFNDPVEQKDHVERSVAMAQAMIEDISALRVQWRERGYPIDVGMGIHTGYATCGFIGYEGRRDYAVIGSVTNLAARLSDSAAGGEILLSSRVRAELADIGHGRYRTELVGDLELKGFQRPQSAFRLLPAA